VRLPTCRRAPRRSATGRSCGRVPAASASPVIRACCTPGRLWANALGHKRSNTNAHVARSQTVEHTRCSATNGRTSTETPADFDRAKSIQPFMTEQRLRSRSSKSSRVDRPRCFVTNGRARALLRHKRSNAPLCSATNGRTSTETPADFDRAGVIQPFMTERRRTRRTQPQTVNACVARPQKVERTRYSVTNGLTRALLGHKRSNTPVDPPQTVELRPKLQPIATEQRASSHL
jgi:hypothetical protein